MISNTKTTMKHTMPNNHRAEPGRKIVWATSGARGAGSATDGPAEAVGADEVGHRLDVFLGVGAEGGEFAVAHAAVGVELESGADEHKAHHAVEIEVAAHALAGRVVKKTGGAGGGHALDHALNEAGGFVFLGETEREAGDGLGDVERLPMVVVVGAMQQRFIDAFAGLVDETFPDWISFFGGAEAEEAERSVGEAVFGGRLREHLRGDAACGEIDDIVALKRGLAGGAVKFAERERDVTGFVGPGLLAVGGQNGAVRLDGFKIVAQH